MRIKPESLTYWIDNFYGYGSWKAPIWFISYEEPGGDLPEEVAERLDYFSANASPSTEHATPAVSHSLASATDLCDIRKLYRHVTYRNEGPRSSLYKNYFDYRFSERAVIHGIWKNLIAFVHGFQGKPLPDLLTYQQQEFASISLCREALIPLYPLPSPHDHAWYYSWLDMPDMPFLKMRAAYEAQVYKIRINAIMRNLQLYKPEVVLMYEMNNINRLKDSVKSFYPAAEFKLAKASKQITPQHHRVQLGRTTLLITTQVPALKHNRKETGFNWEELGRMATLFHNQDGHAVMNF